MPSPVAGIGAPLDQPRRLELGERLGHRLGPNVLGGRECARGLGALPVEPAQDARLSDGEGVLRPEPPQELAQHQPELARALHDLRRRLGHAGDSRQVTCAGCLLSEKPGYKWVALSNTTLGVLLATIDGSIVLIAMPAIFRGIHLDPLQPGTASTCSG